MNIAYVEIDASKDLLKLLKYKYKHKNKIIFVFWHDRLLLMPYIIKHYLKCKGYAIVSNHNDGEYLVNFLSLYSHKAIRGSTNANSIKVMKEAINLLKNDDFVLLAITPDGPRGPRHKIQGNVVALAKMTNTDIVPVCYSASRVKLLDSWDKFIIPIPFIFNNIVIEMSSPIDVNTMKKWGGDSKKGNVKLEEILNKQLQRVENKIKNRSKKH